MIKTALRTALVVPLLVVLGACSSKSAGSPAAAGASAGDDGEAIASSTQTSRIEEMIFSPVSSGEPAQAASSVAAAQWWPAGCAVRKKDASDPAVVHIHLDDCTGPFGMRHHTGDITVVFSKNADGSLHAEATSADMTVNGHAVTFSRSADIAISGATRTVSSHGAWTRVSDAGLTISHAGSYTTTIDTQARCRTTDGTAVTLVGSREIDGTVKGYKLCRKADGSDGCPSGTVTHERKATGDTVTVAFDGSAEAEVTGPRGNTTSIPLVCVP